MKIGVVFPTMEIGNDPIVIRDFAQAAEGLGYAHLTFEEHVVGADPNREGGWSHGPMGNGRPGVTKDASIHEPLVLLAVIVVLVVVVAINPFGVLGEPRGGHRLPPNLVPAHGASPTP
ncbi:MAG: hypothetical protein HYX51_07095 [Chloroflexi bacterium]|nr:hypothetical protein [Chloroflexota bacterium]